MKRIAILFSLALAAAACGGKSKPAEPPATGGSTYGGDGYGTVSGVYGGAGYGGAGYGGAAYQAPTSFDPPLADWRVECDAYKGEIQRYAGCDKVTPEARAALGDATTAMEEGLKQMQDPKITDEVRAQVAGACRQATEALKQALASIGCK